MVRHGTIRPLSGVSNSIKMDIFWTSIISQFHICIIFFPLFLLISNHLSFSHYFCHAFSSTSSSSGGFTSRRQFWIGSTEQSQTLLPNPWTYDHHHVDLHLRSTGDSNNIGSSSIPRTYTHLIAIPLVDCREICVALESVQRAITFNCPSLGNACISTTQARLPLLYVDASTNEDGKSNEILHHLVQETIQIDSKNEVVLPYLMKFQGLEIDGIKNEVLYCVGKSDDDGYTTQRLQSIVYTLRNKLEALGYRTMLPPDKPQIKSTFNVHINSNTTRDETGQQEWRPRIPFMRLPMEELSNSDQETEEEWRSPEDGGNGISPILWYKWWDDEFTEKDGEGIRLNEVALYCRSTISTSESSVDNLSENEFPTPSKKFRSVLPGGYMNDNGYEVDYDSNPSNHLLTNLQEESESSKKKYFTISTDFDSDIDTTLDINYTTAAILNVDDDAFDDTPKVISSANMNQMALEDRTHVESQILSQDALQASNTEILYNTCNEEDDTRSAEFKVKKPWPKEPLINKYNRMQGVKAEAIKEAMQNKEPLPPYPCNEYFIGPWRVVSFPLDTNYANPDSLTQFESHNSDNLILRVDGSVAGGPFLDSKTKQKAAGGTWKMFQAEYIGPPQGGTVPSTSSEKIIRTRMRIVLLVPPLKKEELVMEGEVTRITMPTSLLSRPINAKEGGGNDDVEEEEQDGLLHCGGEAWVREIATGRRKKLGLFTVVKLRTLDPGELHISVPPARKGLL